MLLLLIGVPVAVWKGGGARSMAQRLKQGEGGDLARGGRKVCHFTETKQEVKWFMCEKIKGTVLKKHFDSEEATKLRKL